MIKPYPENVPTVRVCSECNESYSLDEQYFVAFLSAVLSGSTNPEHQKSAYSQRAPKNEGLRSRIELSKRGPLYVHRHPEVTWVPEIERIKNVAIKNARGHIYFENGEPVFEEPSFVSVFPIQVATEDQKNLLWPASAFAGWPEVGSRWMQRVIIEDNFDDDGFYIVQPGTYKFRLDFDCGVTVRSVIHEYLATIVSWKL